jgi:hypothetical protein
LSKNYKKIIYLFAKYKKHFSEDSIESISHTRFVINKLFKHQSDLNKNVNLKPVDINYLRLFIGQKLNFISYPKINFYFHYVQVLKLAKLL